MATWNDVVAHLNSNYKCKQVNEAMIALTFNMGEGRSQIVFVELAGNDRIGEWAKVGSPVGRKSDLKKLEAYCAAAEELVCGGIVYTGEFIMLRDSFPLLNLDVNELEIPLVAITASADSIERSITGGDTY